MTPHRMLRTPLTALALTAALLAGQAQAESPAAPAAAPATNPAAAQDLTPPFLRGIELTAEQKTHINNVINEQIPAVREESRLMREKHDALQAMVIAEKYDHNKARQLVDELTKGMATLTLLRADTDAKLMTLLTPAQRQQVRDQHAARMQGKPAPAKASAAPAAKPAAKPAEGNKPAK